ncbi:dicarboxylate transporter 2.1, chloroplastic-like isoform X3 [Diospyros lotus]|uniref:dicarboxylate transporter 2.1, chloroplastic-like isoform X3 n=1 Tax=Diospyros lotus TaxID=55363 RepID=UPI00225A35DE|nr:dicarboxylate transporter 2.1, chloroplastic-like isoform X3 [Diospyros lotus]
MFSTHSTTNPTSPPPEHCRRWQGAKPVPLAVSLVVGLIFRFAVPKPAHLSKQAWQLLAIFLATMTGLILGPLPVGAWALVCLTVSLLTKTLTLSAAFAAFTNEVIWLIVVSFFFSRGLVKTGLGDRVALYFVKLLGKSTLGLAYGLVLCELLVSPAVPSTTARAGGIFLPLIMSLSLSADSRPNHASAKKLGAFLIQSQLQHGPMFFSASAYTKFCGYCSLFYSMLCHVSGVNYHHAQNLLCVKLAQSLGVKIANPWVTWFKASSLPALISLFSTPIILFKLYPPEIKETPDAPAMATQKLAQMGPVSKIEWAMVGTMLITVALWISGWLCKASCFFSTGNFNGPDQHSYMGVSWNSLVEDFGALLMLIMKVKCNFLCFMYFLVSALSSCMMIFLPANKKRKRRKWKLQFQFNFN